MNTSKEITDVLSMILEDEGYETVSEFTYVFKNNEELFDSFLANHKPDAVVYDIALPYDENYALFLKLSSRSAAEGIPFVLTTTNKDALEAIVGKTGAHEIVGKPFDLSVMLNAVKAALEKSSTPTSHISS